MVMVVVSSGTVAPVSGFQRGERRGGGLFASPRGILSVYRGGGISVEGTRGTVIPTGLR